MKKFTCFRNAGGDARAPLPSREKPCGAKASLLAPKCLPWVCARSFLEGNVVGDGCQKDEKPVWKTSHP